MQLKYCISFSLNKLYSYSIQYCGSANRYPHYFHFMCSQHSYSNYHTIYTTKRGWFQIGRAEDGTLSEMAHYDLCLFGPATWCSTVFLNWLWQRMVPGDVEALFSGAQQNCPPCFMMSIFSTDTKLYYRGFICTFYYTIKNFGKYLNSDLKSIFIPINLYLDIRFSSSWVVYFYWKAYICKMRRGGSFSILDKLKGGANQSTMTDSSALKKKSPFIGQGCHFEDNCSVTHSMEKNRLTL